MIPTFKDAKRAGKKGTPLERLIVLGTPSGSQEEKEFRELLTTVLDEAAKNRKDKTWQQPTPKK